MNTQSPLILQKNSVPKFTLNENSTGYLCSGPWSILELPDLLSQLKITTLPTCKHLTIDGTKLTAFDSAGALTLIHCLDFLKPQFEAVSFINFPAEYQALLDLIQEKQEFVKYKPPLIVQKSPLYSLGKETVLKLSQGKGFLVLIGDISIQFTKAFVALRRFQFSSIVSNIYSAGIQALPIIALLSFLIGVVLAYQMGLQLELYGASSFIAYLSGLALFREFAPLITAIIVAGRTSSAFTAQIGSMKINEEIDAIHTMGLSSTELLVMPKLIGLLLIFPLLVFWADFFGLIGAMIMSKSMLHVTYMDFLEHLQESVGFTQMRLGLYKAPTFAILIALVGCFQGFRVQNSADNIGSQTTKSVVQALFLIIVADAVYSVIYSWINI